MLLSSSQKCREFSLKPSPKKRIHADDIPLSLGRSGQFCTNRISTNTESELQTQPVEHNAAQRGFIEEFVALRVIRIAPVKSGGVHPDRSMQLLHSTTRSTLNWSRPLPTTSYLDQLPRDFPAASRSRDRKSVV